MTIQDEPMSKLAMIAASAAFVGLSLVVPKQASAQDRPTPDECASAVGAIASDTERVRWGILPECGPAGVEALAEALAHAGSETDRYSLRSLTNLSRSVQAEPILHAAERLARDRAATRAARVAALLILLGQYEPSIYPPISVPWKELVSTPLTSCQLSPITDSGYDAEYPMPADYEVQILEVFHELTDDSDPVVQTMAACMARYVGYMRSDEKP